MSDLKAAYELHPNPVSEETTAYVTELEAEVERLVDKQRHADERMTRLVHRNAEAMTLIRQLLPLAERMARAAEVLTDGHASEHQPLIDRATEWLRRMP